MLGGKTERELIQARMERELKQDGHLFPGHKIEIENLSWIIDGKCYPDAHSHGGYSLIEAFQIKAICDDFDKKYTMKW